MRQAPPQPSWFDETKYRRARALNFRGWATQIGNRFYLGTLLDAGKLDPKKLDEFDEHFKLLMTDPFVDLGFKAPFPSDNAVFPLTFGVAKTFTKVLAEANCADKDVCDEKLHELHPDIYAGQAHLFVNLRAPKTLVKKQFANWFETARLKRKRNAAITESVTQSWSAAFPILPYQDLWLWYMRNTGSMLSDGDIANARWCRFASADKDKVRAIRDWADRAFTIEYYNDLVQSAHESEK